MDLGEVVATHEPDKPQPRKPATQDLQGVSGVVRPAQPIFEIADDDAPVPGGGLPRLLEPDRKGRHAGNRFQRVLRRHQPPHLVEIKPFESGQGQMQVTAMSRVERAAKQPDAAMPALDDPAQGRTCPLPRTRYL